MRNFDVVIVGAGPAGSATAIGLARLGYEVALVDKKAFPREKLCGDFVNPINWAIFRDLGVEDRVLAEPHGEVTGFRITPRAAKLRPVSGHAIASARRDSDCGAQRSINCLCKERQSWARRFAWEAGSKKFSEQRKAGI